MKATIIFCIALVAALLLYVYFSPEQSADSGFDSPTGSVGAAADSAETVLNVSANQSANQEPAVAAVNASGNALATFAGGCFWCMEPPYDKLDGVISTTSGYAGGQTENPSYRQVTSGNTGHAEVVQVEYDADTIGYQQLLEVFWVNIDPLTANRQFCDRGSQYRSAIFYHDERQRELALASLQQLRESDVLDGDIVTEIQPLQAFYPAEQYHQDFYQKNALRYKSYRAGCGRDARLNKLWGDSGFPADDQS